MSDNMNNVDRDRDIVENNATPPPSSNHKDHHGDDDGDHRRRVYENETLSPNRGECLSAYIHNHSHANELYIVHMEFNNQNFAIIIIIITPSP